MSQLSNLFQRVIIGGLLGVLTLILIFFSQVFYVAIAIHVFIAVLALLASIEFIKLSKTIIPNLSNWWLPTLAVLLVLTHLGVVFFHKWWGAPFVVLTLFVALLAALYFKKIAHAIQAIAVQLLGVFFFVVPLIFMVSVLYFSRGDGRFYLLLLIFATKLTDIGAYFTGKLLGKHSLASVLSPRKTLEGAVGGLVLALIGAGILFPWLAEKFSFWELMLWTVILSILSQISDLTESLLKREAQVKDSSKLPGFGGFLDLLDSFIFTSPLWFMIVILR